MGLPNHLTSLTLPRTVSELFEALYDKGNCTGAEFHTYVRFNIG